MENKEQKSNSDQPVVMPSFNMTNYENDIMSLLQGETLKQKYDWLFDQLSKLSSAKAFVHALHGTWDEASIKNIRNFINDINEKLNG